MELPVTIHRHWIGLAAIAIGTTLASLFVLYLFLWLYVSGMIAAPFIWYGVALSAVILAIGLIAARVYWLSTIVLTTTGIKVNSWLSLFYDIESECTWSRVQDVTATQAGIVAQLFDYGTLLIQTAGTHTYLQLNTVPDADAWRARIIDQRGA